MNTPSHHRVHHAVNPRYLDRNYAGVFIVWDRLFGSFEPERDDDPPRYGIVKPLGSFNLFWAALPRMGRAWPATLAAPGWAKLAYLRPRARLEPRRLARDQRHDPGAWREAEVGWLRRKRGNRRSIIRQQDRSGLKLADPDGSPRTIPHEDQDMHSG